MSLSQKFCYKNNKRRKRAVLLLLLTVILALPACVPVGGNASHLAAQEGVLTYAALNPLSREQKRRIEVFNKNHPDARIEVVDYSDEGGIERLMTEIALGWVPDIMELYLYRPGGTSEHRPTYGTGINGERLGGKKTVEGEYWMPYRQLARKGYLADLWPYIENDPEPGREGLLEAPMKAAEVDGGLYMLFREVYISTLIGMERVVGDRDGWTLEELMETFSSMPEGSTILRYNKTRWEMYSQIFSTTLDRYIDWETGQCFFDNDEFCSMLEFLSTLPAEFETSLTPAELKEELVWRRLKGEQMLESVLICCLKDISWLDTAFGTERAAYVGYPTEDGSSGSFFNIYGTTLAMASNCQNKEAAWEFMRYLACPGLTVAKMSDALWNNDIVIPVNRKSYENGCIASLKESKARMVYSIPPLITFPGGPEFETEFLTEENHLRRYEKLINRTTQLYWPDDALSEVVWDAIGPYFAGDKTMDETIQMVQNRVTLYVNENR